tara:strand:+ start:1125 stop:1652 length:528 start_codon:yes stop_codon:yes gene_type:complete
MNLNTLQIEIDNVHTYTHVGQYNIVLKACADKYEMAAMVHVYDTLKKHHITPTDATYAIINRLHSKTCPESKHITIPTSSDRTLASRRRIHKIMKGFNYTRNYKKAMIHLPGVISFVNANPYVKVYSRGKLVRTLEQRCGITSKEAMYIITKLKRIKFFKEATEKQNTLDAYFNV